MFIVFAFISCKGMNFSDSGNFILKNNSDKVVEFIWITPEGTLFPPAKSMALGKSEVFELRNMKEGRYEIAIDFKGEFNTFNSKKDPSKVLVLTKGETKIWIINEQGFIFIE